jgi:DNA-binding transcriptional regulator YhcF (GntR family)
MNKHFLTGFIKAANEAGMNEEQIEALLPQHGGGAPEGTPEHEAAETPHEEEIEKLLSQLSPEELEQLIAEVTHGHGGGAEHGEEAEQIPGVAAGIEQQLSQHPDVAEQLAPQPGADDAALAKQSAINFIKSANYVEGFLEQALGRGLGLKQAVELYDTAFTTTFNQLKQSELIGGQKKLDVNHNGKIDADDLKKIRENKAPVAEEKKAEKEEKACDCGGTCAACKAKAEKEEKTAAYYEGIVERAREYGLSDAQTLAIVKEAGLANAAGEAVTNGLTRGKTALKGFKDDAKELASKHKGISLGLGAAAVGGTGIAAGRASKD